MSNIECVSKPLVIPAESDAALISRLKYEGKFLKASIWLHNLIIHRIEDVDAVASCYRTGNFSPCEGKNAISELFSQKNGIFCRRFEYYCRMILKYQPGHLPTQYCLDDFRLVTILLNRLYELSEDKTHVRQAERLVTSLYHLITNVTDKVDGSAYKEKINSLHDEICAIFAKISDDFYRQEQATKMPAPQPATKEDVEQIVTEATEPIKITVERIDVTSTTINRRDQKYRRKSKQKFTPEQQDGIDSEWQAAKNDPAVQALSEGKATYEAAFIQRRRRFEAYGANSAKDIGRALRAKSERLARMAKRK